LIGLYLTDIMVRNYQRTSTRQSWSEESMQNAVTAVKSGEMGIKRASGVFCVPKSTLRLRARDKNKLAKDGMKGLGGKRPMFLKEIEQDLVNYLTNMEVMLFGLTIDDVRCLAYQIAKRNGLSGALKDDSDKVGRDWVSGFLCRHPEISIRTPEATSAARARGFNKVSVGKFFDLLETVFDKHHFAPNNIYNVDETGMTTVQGKGSKILALKGRRQVGCLTSAERGQLVTMVACMSVTGAFVPPLFIFPRVRMKQELMDGAPPGSVSACHPSGWMQLEIFSTWFDHFVKFSGATLSNPVLLILDGHATHVRNIDVINKARDSGVVIICLPPHCSHRMQPLDVSFMKPLSSYYNTEIEKWLRNHPGRTVTVFQIAQLITPAYLKAATALVAANGFRKSGIWPLNRDIFDEHEFAPSHPTDLPENQSCEEATTAQHRPMDIPENLSNGENESPASPLLSAIASPNIDTFDSTADHVSGDLIAIDIEIDINTGFVTLGEVTEVDATGDSLICASSSKESEVIVPSTSGYSSGFVTAAEISPYPKMHESTRRRVRKSCGAAAILTSSPYKTSLEEYRATKKSKPKIKAGKKRSNKGEVDGKECFKSTKTKKTKSQNAEVSKPKTPKTKGKEKATKTKLIVENVEEVSTEDLTPCGACGVTFAFDHEAKNGRNWIQCQTCLIWYHNICQGLLNTDEVDGFICISCDD